MLKQRLVTMFAVLFIFLSGMPAVLPAYAASGNTQGNFFSGLIQFIAQKFGLDQNTVKTAVTQYQNQVKATITPRPSQTPEQLAAREKTRLDKLVSAGTITSAQEALIINELATLRSKYNPANFKNLTADQRKQQFQNEQNDIKAWAQANGIDPKYVMPGFGMAGQGGFRGQGFGGKGHRPSPTPTP